MIRISLGSHGDSGYDYYFDPRDGTPAAWIYDGEIELVGDEASATIVPEGRQHNDTPSYRLGESKRMVPCFDFSKWIEQFRGEEVFVKMDIEGAEYDILEHMIQQGTIDIVSLFRIEWHDWLFPHNAERSARLKEVIPWEPQDITH